MLQPELPARLLQSICTLQLMTGGLQCLQMCTWTTASAATNRLRRGCLRRQASIPACWGHGRQHRVCPPEPLRARTGVLDGHIHLRVSWSHEICAAPSAYSCVQRLQGIVTSVVAEQVPQSGQQMGSPSMTLVWTWKWPPTSTGRRCRRLCM